MKFKIGKDIECADIGILEKSGNKMEHGIPVSNFKQELQKYKGKDLNYINKLYKNIVYVMVMGKSETNGIQKCLILDQELGVMTQGKKLVGSEQEWR